MAHLSDYDSVENSFDVGRPVTWVNGRSRYANASPGKAFRGPDPQPRQEASTILTQVRSFLGVEIPQTKHHPVVMNWGDQDICLIRHPNFPTSKHSRHHCYFPVCHIANNCVGCQLLFHDSALTSVQKLCHCGMAKQQQQQTSFLDRFMYK